MKNCKSTLDNFCYVCGHFKSNSNKRKHGSISEDFKRLYQKYFDRPFITGEWFMPKLVCKTCYNILFEWKRTQGKKQMNFDSPMIWTQPKNGEHDPSNCYACANFVPGQNTIKMRKHIYKAVESAQIPKKHGKNIQQTYSSPNDDAGAPPSKKLKK